MACLLSRYTLGVYTNAEIGAYRAFVSFLAVRRDVFRAENTRVAQNILRALTR